ncbi:hypothetical protein DPMN_044635 [Dreissena polymorpha]|uniref:Uncharacterized protein n=1 Tax=Dreissena polymorpha TaxID=45954 RepID=A0A9D4D3K5_DREPO|nr:hypothetical protein DPMN_044635 [Dreissena polymorpha]
MFRVDARVNGIEVQAVVETAAEVTLVSDQVVDQLQEKVPMLEQVFELIVLRKHEATIDVVGAALGLSGQMVALAQERGLGKGKFMLRGSLWRVLVKAVSHFRFIQVWLMHGTDPPGNFCAFMIVRNRLV